MDIYVAWMQENYWETEPWNIGCYSTNEKAEEAILEELRDMELEHYGESVLSLEIYDSMSDEERHFIYGVEKYKLDE